MRELHAADRARRRAEPSRAPQRRARTAAARIARHPAGCKRFTSDGRPRPSRPRFRRRRTVRGCARGHHRPAGRRAHQGRTRAVAPRAGRRAASPPCSATTRTRPTSTSPTRWRRALACATSTRCACSSTKARERVTELIALGAVFDREHGRTTARWPARAATPSLASCTPAAPRPAWRSSARSSTRRRRTAASVMEKWLAVDLIVEDGKCRGVLARTPEGERVEVRATHTLLATGGAGQLFAVTTNPEQATGDGIAMASARRRSRRRRRVHAVPSHGAAPPRDAAAVAERGAARSRRAAARQGRRAVRRRAVAPRRRVARDAAPRWPSRASTTCGSTRPDSRSSPSASRPSRRRSRRSASTRRRTGCRSRPAAHYLSGGVVTDLDGRAAVEGLWAAGETACVGVHGANRLASNSLARRHGVRGARRRGDRGRQASSPRGDGRDARRARRSTAASPGDGSTGPETARAVAPARARSRQDPRRAAARDDTRCGRAAQRRVARGNRQGTAEPAGRDPVVHARRRTRAQQPVHRRLRAARRRAGPRGKPRRPHAHRLPRDQRRLPVPLGDSGERRVVCTRRSTRSARRSRARSPKTSRRWATSRRRWSIPRRAVQRGDRGAPGRRDRRHAVRRGDLPRRWTPTISVSWDDRRRRPRSQPATSSGTCTASSRRCSPPSARA